MSISLPDLPDLPLESLTFQALNGLNVARRVILTGTPIQVCKQRTISEANLTSMEE
jgi:SNF2 family DNA or RNA helicase